MTFEVEGTKFRIVFSHTAPFQRELYPRRKWRKLRRSTSCHIERMGPDGIWHPVVSSLTECSVQDRFVKETGRQIALRRALRGFRYPEIAARTYFERARKK